MTKHSVLIVFVLQAVVFAEIAKVRELKPADRKVYVDSKGLLCWEDNNEEVALFGVNYCLPSGYSYRAVKYFGADHKKTIDADMAHLARMGLDGLRICFWGDWENSDREGNLVDNVHLDLLDYTICKAKARGLYVLLTPIILYSPVWPELEELNDNQGFARFYPKYKLGTDPKAIKVQQNYLSQVTNHVNRYAGMAYKDDPGIAMLELINEPIHHPNKKPVEYINALVEAVKSTGCQKPLFLNVSQNMSIARAIGDSELDGAVFGWYPTGLVNGFSLQGNFLPRVDDFPQMLDSALNNRAKLVYEFDAPDVAESYIYPAIARTLRTRGIQFAAMFSYDPFAIASHNLEYQTHYLNLIYTPNKAVSYIIAAEAFRHMPMYKSYGKYPENTRFGPVRVSYEEDISEMITEKEFLYSNDTKALHPSPGKLERIIGCGSSSVVNYKGTGSYFLEKLKPGIWRLEAYPDVVWVKDPYGKPSRDRESSRLIWRKRKMEIALPDLGDNFSLKPINKGNSFNSKVENGAFLVAPGVYLLKRDGMSADLDTGSTFEQIQLSEFIVPQKKNSPVSVWHEPPRELVQGRKFVVKAQVASATEPKNIKLGFRQEKENSFQQVPMRMERPYQYSAEVPAEELGTGALEYAIWVETEDALSTFPAQINRKPQDITRVFPDPVIIYTAKPDSKLPNLKQWSMKDASAKVIEIDDKTSVLRIETLGFGSNGSMSLEIPVDRNKQKASTNQPPQDKKYEEVILKVRARALYPNTTKVRLNLFDKYNMTYPVTIPLEEKWSEYEIPLRDFCIANLDIIRLSLGAWMFPSHKDSLHELEIEKITLQPSANIWKVPIVKKLSPFVLFDAQNDRGKLFFPNTEHRVKFVKSSVKGMTPTSRALRVDVPDFRSPPHDVSFRLAYGKEIDQKRVDLSSLNLLRLRARAASKETNRLELALIQRDGSVWGTKVALETNWREIEIPLDRLTPTVITFLPRPYPTIFNYWDQGSVEDLSTLNLKEIEAIQFSFGSRLFPDAIDKQHSIEVESLVLIRIDK